MKKKITRFISLTCVALFLTGAVFLAGCSSTGEESHGDTSTKSAQEIATDAFNNLETAENYDIDMNMNMSMEVMGKKIDAIMNGSGSYFNDPLKMKMAISMDMNMGSDQTMDMETYFLQEGNNYVMYTYAYDMWQKTTLTENDLSGQMMQMSPADSMDLYMRNLKEAVKEGEEKIGDINTDKIKLVASGDIFKELMSNMNMGGLESQFDSFTAEVISNLGDLTYYIWVNKTDTSLVKMQMDLSPAMRNLGSIMTGDNAPPEMAALSETEKEMLKQSFESMEVSVDYTINNINGAADFTLPEEAANAIEAPLPQ